MISRALSQLTLKIIPQNTIKAYWEFDTTNIEKVPPKAINPFRLTVPNHPQPIPFRKFAKEAWHLNKNRPSLLTSESIIKAWDEATKHWLSHDSKAQVHTFEQAYTLDNQTFLQSRVSRIMQSSTSTNRTPLDIKLPEQRPINLHFEDFVKGLQNRNPGWELDQDEISAAFTKFVDLKFPTRELGHRGLAEALRVLRREEKAYWKKRS